MQHAMQDDDTEKLPAVSAKPMKEAVPQPDAASGKPGEEITHQPQPVHSTMPAKTFPLFKPEALRDIIVLFLGTRLMLVLATCISFILFPVAPHTYPETKVNVSALLASWNRWDALFYQQIAQNGYRHIYDTAFFPLFPMFVRVVAFFFGNRDYALASLLVSNLALLGAIAVLYQIATDAAGERIGRRTILYLCLFPTAFFFFAGYNESLFLFFSCSSLFAMRRQKWLLAGILGLLASGTRSAGVLLVFPYLYEIWAARDLSRVGWFAQLKGLFLKALPLMLIPGGLLLYCLYCWHQFGNPLSFVTVQSGWGRHSNFPWVGIVDAFWQIFVRQPVGSFFDVHILLDLTATLGFMALAIMGWRKLRVSYTLWIGFLLLYTLLSPSTAYPDVLVSNQRFVLEMFPGFITLAILGTRHPRVHQAIMIFFPFLQAILAALFVLNRWMV